MTFYDFDIMADQPADPTVNVVTQLNNNWDKFDSRLTNNLQLATDINNIPLAQRETGMLIAGRLAGINGLFYWNGAAWVKPVDYTKAWTSWADVQLAVGRFYYTDAPLRWRRNTALRLVELSGGLVSSTAWPGTYTSIVALTGSGIPNTFKPIGIDNGRSFGIVASFPQVDLAPSSQYSTGSCLVKGNGPATDIDLQIKFYGQDTPPVGEGRGFFFDRMRWFY